MLPFLKCSNHQQNVQYVRKHRFFGLRSINTKQSKLQLCLENCIQQLVCLRRKWSYNFKEPPLLFFPLSVWVVLLNFRQAICTSKRKKKKKGKVKFIYLLWEACGHGTIISSTGLLDTIENGKITPLGVVVKCQVFLSPEKIFWFTLHTNHFTHT